MFYRFILVVPFLLLSLSITKAQNSEFYDYIEKYKKVAIKEMERAGVPASIKLAQGILESNAGRSELARKANNHFGMKCGGDWKGKTFHKEDDDYDEFGNLQKSCFRSYRKAEDSYIAHSEFLRDPRKAHIYGFLFRIKTTDYKRWAKGLKSAGYATAGNYDSKLINLIETYNLNQYDEMGTNAFPDRPDGLAIAGLDLRKINGAKVVFAKKHITVQDISLKTGVSQNALKRYNENLPEVSDSLVDDYRIFLQPKRNKFRGKKKWHYVRNAETMFDISQEYGVKLKKLFSRNRMAEGTQPQPDERIKLQGCRVKSGDRPRLMSEPVPEKVPVILDADDGFMDDDITPENPTTPRPPTTSPTTPTTSPTAPTTQPTTPSTILYYTVLKGDTLYSISQSNGLTVDQLMKLNNLTSTTLSIGQVLRVK